MKSKMRFQDTIAFAGMMVFIEYVIYWIYPILGGGHVLDSSNGYFQIFTEC